MLIHTTGLFEDAEKFYNNCHVRPVRLYNLLDSNNTNPGFYDKTIKDYQNCEIATTISITSKNKIIERLNISREINVIGFPARPVKFLKNHRGFCSLYVGRWNDPNKRTYLIKPSLELLGQDTENDLVVVSSDKPPFNCFYHNNVNDEILNLLYNGAEFTWLPSKQEGLGMSAIEAIQTGSIPLLCNDNDVVRELGLKDFSANPNPEALSRLVRKIQKNINYYWNKMDELRPKFEKQFSIDTVSQNILDLYQNYVSTT